MCALVLSHYLLPIVVVEPDFPLYDSLSIVDTRYSLMSFSPFWTMTDEPWVVESNAVLVVGFVFL